MVLFNGSYCGVITLLEIIVVFLSKRQQSRFMKWCFRALRFPMCSQSSTALKSRAKGRARLFAIGGGRSPPTLFFCVFAVTDILYACRKFGVFLLAIVSETSILFFYGDTNVFTVSAPQLFEGVPQYRYFCVFTATPMPIRLARPRILPHRLRIATTCGVSATGTTTQQAQEVVRQMRTTG